MRKVILIAGMVIAMSAFMAEGAMALGIHTTFYSNTDSCAECHVTHSAVGSQLLARSNQTSLCYVCHGDYASGSGLDVQSGINLDYGTTPPTPTTGGGFDMSKGFTSIHNVNGTTDVAGTVNTSAPGGGALVNGILECGSCHDPHGSPNSRLLKATVNGVSGISVSMAYTTDGKSQIASYNSGSAAFCAACHYKFNKVATSGDAFTSVATSPGGATTATDTMYRHAMGVTLTTALNTTESSIMTGTPLETGAVVCLTCHRAHGSKSQATGYAATWHRDADGATTTNSGSGSALLRMDNRGVCYNCHKAATQNHR